MRSAIKYLTLDIWNKNTYSQATMSQSVEHATAARANCCSSLGHSIVSLVEIWELVKVVNGSEKNQRLSKNSGLRKCKEYDHRSRRNA